MVAWRRTAGSLPVEGFTQDPSNNGVYFSRGGLAFVALNRGESGPWSAWMDTRLPPGAYCNVIQSDDPASCTNIEVNSSGIAWISVPPVGAVALHVAKRFSGPSSGGGDGHFLPWGIVSFCLLGVLAFLLCLLGYFGEEERRTRKRKRIRTKASEKEANIEAATAEEPPPAAATLPKSSVVAGAPLAPAMVQSSVQRTMDLYGGYPRSYPGVRDPAHVPLLLPVASGQLQAPLRSAPLGVLPPQRDVLVRDPQRHTTT